ncbi:mucin-5AC-like isoform X2 [Mya arenaria]|uniref:mucin-5AC-like isoform X2 n=1 Tax=Mya arenaria TaxID=6604 RepID=UPI0022DF4399|nr:mucin-5AC-like isoform X2 [Mya arenaria]
MHLIVKDYFPCDMTILLILRLFFVLPIIIDGQFNNPTTAAVIDPNCVDKISTCWHLPDEKCKAPYEDWARSNCAFRCGFCLGLPTTLPPCEDLLPDCANFDISVCSDSTYRPWASINCRLYCRHEFCSAAQIQAAQSRATTIAPEDCYDKVNCSLYATNVCDGNYTLWVRENCPQYCGICRGVPTRPPPCVDTIPNCKDYNASTCTNPLLNLWVKDKCRKHCGLCSSQPVSPPQPGKRNHALKNRLLLNSGFPSTTTEPPCEDTRDNCILYRHSACTNATYGPFMRKNCAKYCGFCVDATSSSHSTVPPTIEKRNQEGEDLAPDRRQFQASHHHEIMPNICLDNYDENCATMQPPASEFPGSEFKPHPKTDPDWDSNSAPPCEDKSDNCISYGRYACTAYYYVAFMQKYCAKYCEFCNDTNSVVECKDANPQCAEYDTGDLCTDPRYDAWNLENCMLYCKVYPCNASSITVATNSSTTNAVSSTETTATAQSTVLATTGDTQKPHGHSTAVVTTHGHGNSNTDHTNNARTNDNSTSTTSAPCEDKKDNCISYGRSACTNDAYVAFMRNNCAKFCGFCNDTNSGVECKDRNPLCGQYDTGDLCTDPQYDAWNLENCMLYCKVYPCNEGQDLARDRRQFHGSHHHQGSSNDCWDSNAQNCSAIPTLEVLSTAPAFEIASEFPGSEFKPHPKPDPNWDSKPSTTAAPSTQKPKPPTESPIVSSSTSTSTEVSSQPTDSVVSSPTSPSTQIQTTANVKVSPEVSSSSNTVSSSPSTDPSQATIGSTSQQSVDNLTSTTLDSTIPSTASTTDSSISSSTPQQVTQPSSTAIELDTTTTGSATPQPSVTASTKNSSSPTTHKQSITTQTPSLSTDSTITSSIEVSSTSSTASTTDSTISSSTPQQVTQPSSTAIELDTTTTGSATPQPSITASTNISSSSTTHKQSITTQTPPLYTESTITSSINVSSTSTSTIPLITNTTSEPSPVTSSTTITTLPTVSSTQSTQTASTPPSKSTLVTTTLSPTEITTQNSTAVSTTSAPCEDKRDNCIYLGRSACTNDAYVAFMRKNCAKFCGFCNDTNSVVECKDANPQCAEYDSGDLCTDPQYDAWNLENCMLYCKVYPCNEATNSSSTNAVSSTETTVRAQPTVLATTGDTQKPHGRSTAVVTTHGHGNSNTGHTNNAHTNDNSTSTTSAPCEDKKDNCISYGRSACTDVAYAPFLRKNCAKFCGFCVDPNSVAECKDRNPLCSQYDTGDLCTDPQYETWNLENCMLYCKVYPCNGTITTPSTL